ncbi:hypothetical protein V6N13_017039 [Hibiscus sabdariffa]
MMNDHRHMKAPVEGHRMGTRGKEDVPNKDKATYASMAAKTLFVESSINGGLGVANENVIVLEADVIIDR